MTREEAVRAVLRSLPRDAIVVAANGHTSRQLHALEDRPEHFYMIGSMSLGPSIALGIALARPERRVAVLDGDGNVLMGLGSLASVAVERPARFLHVCLDNGTHASTGGQPTISRSVDLAAVASACGYVWSARAVDPGEAERSVREAAERDGPAFLLLEVEPGGIPEGTPRVAATPEEMTRRTREVLGT